jgi:hypothetical protein
MKNLFNTLLFIFILVFLIIGCTKDEDEDPPSNSGQQGNDGYWSGNTEQGLLVTFDIIKKNNSTILTSFLVNYQIGDNPEFIKKGNQDGIAHVADDTIAFSFPVDINLEGRFWNTNFFSGKFEIFNNQQWHTFTFSASKLGNPITIHSASMYSIQLDNDYINNYTYVDGFSAGYDTVKHGNNVIFSSFIYTTSSRSKNQENLMEIRIGSLYEPFDAGQFRDLIRTGFINFSINAENGVEVVYRDGSDNFRTWSTSMGSANQNGSAFEISQIDLLSGTDSTFLLYKMMANFKCKVYDTEGNSKQIVQGLYLGFTEAVFND